MRPRVATFDRIGLTEQSRGSSSATARPPPSNASSWFGCSSESCARSQEPARVRSDPVTSLPVILSHVHCQGLLPRPAQPRLDALLGALGWMVENVLLLRAIDHERQPPLDIH